MREMEVRWKQAGLEVGRRKKGAISGNEGRKGGRKKGGEEENRRDWRSNKGGRKRRRDEMTNGGKGLGERNGVKNETGLD